MEAPAYHPLLRVLTPKQVPNARVVVAGSTPELGNWNPQAAPTMKRSGIPLWTVTLPEGLDPDTEFKFVIIIDDELIWEDGPNRTLSQPGPLEFRGLTPWRAAGVAVPVFSLRSYDDFGVGDFADLRLLVDWAARTGQQLIQILPVNDTTMWRTKDDSYPYNANSSFALHPLYLRPQLLGTLSDKAEADRFEELRRELQSKPDIDYPAVMKAKEVYARAVFAERGDAAIASAAFADFTGRNARWLLPYAAWCVLRDKNGTPDFRQWPESNYSPAIPARLLLGPERREMLFYMWLQYQLHRQLSDAVRYARSRGVAVKGDIPIGVSANSADAWENPQLFNLGMCAGAPPDDFATDGQNWGFPTYNWQRMARDGFAWWRRRLERMAEYFDAYRIDHILGFFRIWEIPAGVRSGLLGHFAPALPLAPDEMMERYGFLFNPAMAAAPGNDPTDVLFVADPVEKDKWHPRIEGYKTRAYSRLPYEQQQAYCRLHEDFFYARHNDFWRRSALLKLPALVNATPMLACAEDLGMIPACVPQVLEQQRILALEIQRMPKQYGRVLSDPSAYGYMNVASTSTHDMEPLRLWWTARPDQSKYFGPEATPAACRRIIAEHTSSPAMLAVMPIQDWLSISTELRRENPAEEQINIPSVPDHYWRYRLHLPLEEINASARFCADVSNLALRR